MMKIDILTLFPEMCEVFLKTSIIGRAVSRNLVQVCCHQIRDFAFDKHKRVDDTPYGGGKGMLMLAEPIACCYESICKTSNKKIKLIYMSPKGKVLNQKKLKELSVCEDLAILCGHYEGIDERVIEMHVDEQISIGDFVLTGGELPALVLIDGIVRLLPGVLADSICFEEESHFNNLLEYPQYTKPAVWRGKQVPEVLLNGHHKKIREWKDEQSFYITKKFRPDLI